MQDLLGVGGWAGSIRNRFMIDLPVKVKLVLRMEPNWSLMLVFR